MIASFSGAGDFPWWVIVLMIAIGAWWYFRLIFPKK
jgi:hypothetical protein